MPSDLINEKKNNIQQNEAKPFKTWGPSKQGENQNWKTTLLLLLQ